MGFKKVLDLTTQVAFSTAEGLTVDSAGNLLFLGFDPKNSTNPTHTLYELTNSSAGYAASPVALATFPYYPAGGIAVDAAGNIVGDTFAGGTNGQGTIFELTGSSSGYSASPITLFNFDQYPNINSPSGNVLFDSSGNLYGYTQFGPPGTSGTVFELAKTANGYASIPTYLFNFPGMLVGNATYSNGIGKLAMDANGDFFSVVINEHVNSGGDVIEVAKTPTGYASTPTTLGTIASGLAIGVAVVVDPAGDVFGTTGLGGTNGVGSIFEIPKTAFGYGAVTTLYSFTSGTDGKLPDDIIIDSAGNLYGIANNGGANGGGTVWELEKTGGVYSTSLTVLHSFSGNDGSSPNELTMGTDGVLYGYTQSGGANKLGVIFEITPSVPFTGTAISAAASWQNGDITGPVTITDSAANISANLDVLQGIAAAKDLASVKLTDGGIATISISAAQLVNDAAAIQAVSGNFTLLETAPATNSTVSGASTALGNSMHFSGPVSQYTITAAGDGIHFSVTGNGVTDTLSNIQAVQFSDHTLIVAQAPGTDLVTAGNVTELYAAVFGRLPDVPGLAYYQQELAANSSLSLLSLAQNFLASPEYQNSPAHNYAQGTAGDAQFIADSYSNLLHRAPETAAVPYYQDVINRFTQGLTPGTASYAQAEAQGHALVLTYLSQSAEFLGDVEVTPQSPASAQHWLVLI